MQKYEKSYNQCPFCESPNIEAHKINIPDNDITTQDIECHDCGKQWRDIYKLVGYEEITD